jgi:CBS domain-containing protein
MLARDLMKSPARVIAESADLHEALDLMIQNHLSGLPVVNAQGVVTGMLTEGDLLRRGELGTASKSSLWRDLLSGAGSSAATYVRQNSRTVGDVMTHSAICIEDTRPSSEIVALMERHHIKRIPVLRDGLVVGIVSRADLLEALYKALPKPDAPRSDVQIEADIQHELKAQRWAPTSFITVSVREGIAYLEGSLTDERQREALRICCEKVPGVRAVRDHLAWVGPVGILDTPPPS